MDSALTDRFTEKGRNWLRFVVPFKDRLCIRHDRSEEVLNRSLPACAVLQKTGLKNESFDSLFVLVENPQILKCSSPSLQK